LKKGFPNCLQAGLAMVLPFLLPIALQYILPNLVIIPRIGKVVVMIWIAKVFSGLKKVLSQSRSFQGRVDRLRGEHY
jgi:hypothetical protein